MQANRHDEAGTVSQPAAHVERLDPVANIASHRLMRRSASSAHARCVFSDHLSEDCSCPVSIPARAVIAAWTRRQRAGVHGDRFFHFSWRGEVWLGYGLRDGSIRGVYCPAHSAERDARTGAESAHACSSLAHERTDALAVSA
jgi:hypothetical protein